MREYTTDLRIIVTKSKEHPGFYEAEILDLTEGAFETKALARDEAKAVAFALRDLSDTILKLIRKEQNECLPTT